MVAECDLQLVYIFLNPNLLHTHPTLWSFARPGPSGISSNNKYCSFLFENLMHIYLKILFEHLKPKVIKNLLLLITFSPKYVMVQVYHYCIDVHGQP
jgi:hypothetical protein